MNKWEMSNLSCWCDLQKFEIFCSNKERQTLLLSTRYLCPMLLSSVDKMAKVFALQVHK